MAAGEVGVRGGRIRERDMAEENEATTMSTVLEETTPTVKRRKLEEEVDVESRIVFSPCVQATNRGGTVARNSAGASETSVVIVRRRDSPVEEQCQIPNSEYDLLDRASVSCCSINNRSEEKSKRRIEFVDVEEDHGGDLDQTETSWIYDNFNTRRDPEQEESVNMDSAAVEIQEVETRRRLRMKKKKKKKSRETVKEDEVEDFFQTAEKDLRNKMLECSRRYNFDFENDEPLDGRYEWVKLNT